MCTLEVSDAKASFQSATAAAEWQALLVHQSPTSTGAANAPAAVAAAAERHAEPGLVEFCRSGTTPATVLPCKDAG